MNDDIQKARDVLAKWRGGMSPKSWDMSPMREDGDWTIWSGQGLVATIHGWEGDAQTIIGTAGNPYLLDALDGALAPWVTTPDYLVPLTIMPIAAAIIAADNRMQQ